MMVEKKYQAFFVDLKKNMRLVAPIQKYASKIYQFIQSNGWKEFFLFYRFVSVTYVALQSVNFYLAAIFIQFNTLPLHFPFTESNIQIDLATTFLKTPEKFLKRQDLSQYFNNFFSLFYLPVDIKINSTKGQVTKVTETLSFGDRLFETVKITSFEPIIVTSYLFYYDLQFSYYKHFYLNYKNLKPNPSNPLVEDRDKAIKYLMTTSESRSKPYIQSVYDLEKQIVSSYLKGLIDLKKAKADTQLYESQRPITFIFPGNYHKNFFYSS
jgi:hypothetical protein